MKNITSLTVMGRFKQIKSIKPQTFSHSLMLTYVKTFVIRVLLGEQVILEGPVCFYIMHKGIV